MYTYTHIHKCICIHFSRIYIFMHLYLCMNKDIFIYMNMGIYGSDVLHGVATISRLLKIKGSFAEYSLFYRALLHKRHIILRSLLIVATNINIWQFPLIMSRYLRGGGLGSRPKKMYGERLGDGVEYHLMSATPRR